MTTQTLAGVKASIHTDGLTVTHTQECKQHSVAKINGNSKFLRATKPLKLLKLLKIVKSFEFFGCVATQWAECEGLCRRATAHVHFMVSKIVRNENSPKRNSPVQLYIIALAFIAGSFMACILVLQEASGRACPLVWTEYGE